MLKKFFRWLLKPLINYLDKPYSTEFVEDPVDAPLKDVLYVIGTPDQPWQVEMLCPCRCSEKIVLPVNKETMPRWKLNVDDKNIPTLSPSIWRSKGCKSHFFLRQGRIVWAKPA